MYTLEELQAKTFKELKAIGYQLNLLPAGDKRCRQNWIDAIAGVLPPLLQLLEVSPAEVEPVEEAIGFQVQEPSIESKFGRIVYSKPAKSPIAQEAKTSPGVENFTEADRPPNRGDNGRDRLESAIEQAAENLTPGGVDAKLAAVDTKRFRPEGAGIYHPRIDTAESDGDSSSIETETLGSQKCDRVLAPAWNSETSQRRALPHRSDELTAAVKDSTAYSLSGLLDSLAQALSSIDSPSVTFSSRFLALYSPPRSESIHYKPGSDGQLNLLDFETESTDEPPDPDDFDGNMFAFWAAYDAWHEAHPDDSSEHCSPSSEHCSPSSEHSLPSMCFDVQASEMPDANEIIETSSITLKMPTVSDFVVSILFEGNAYESSSTCKFLIPIFDAWCDRPNNNEPPTAGFGARRPLPTPPSFPPASVAWCDRSSIEKFARLPIPLSGRAPPGGDAVPFT